MSKRPAEGNGVGQAPGKLPRMEGAPAAAPGGGGGTLLAGGVPKKPGGCEWGDAYEWGAEQGLPTIRRGRQTNLQAPPRSAWGRRGVHYGASW